MKKNRYFMWLIPTVLLGLNSCMSDTKEEIPTNKEEKNEISFRVSMPVSEGSEIISPDFSSGRINYDDTSMNLTWEYGDRLRLVGFDANGNFKGVSDFHLEGNAGTSETIFNGTEVTGAVQYDIYYPVNSVNSKGERVPMDYSNQIQTYNNTTNHLKKHLLMKSNGRIPAKDLKLETKDIPLSMQNTIIRFDLTNLPDNFIWGIDYIDHLNWNIKDVNSNIIKNSTLLFKNVQVPRDRKITAFMCFEDMNINKGEIISVSLKGSGFSLIHQCMYNLKVNQDITYSANKRYIATIDFINDKFSTFRIYYTNDFKFDDSVFDPQPSGNFYDPETKKGYLDFDPGFIFKTTIRIKDEAFANTDAKSIVIPEGIEHIGYGAFKNCPQLESVILPSSVKTLGEASFENCKNLKQVILPDGLQTINTHMFKGCESLERIELPTEISDIKADIFLGCNNLKEIHIKTENPPHMSVTFPYELPQNTKNPLGINDNTRIYIPSGSMDKYTVRKFLSSNPWALYKGKYIEE